MSILFYHVVPSKMRDFAGPLYPLATCIVPAGTLTTIGPLGGAPKPEDAAATVRPIAMCEL